MRRLTAKATSPLERRVSQSILAAALTEGDTTVAVLSATAFPSDGKVTVAGADLAYTEIDLAEDTGAASDVLTLAAPSPVAAAVDAPVSVSPAHVRYVLLVSIAGQPPVQAFARHRLTDAAALQEASEASPIWVELEEDDDGSLTVVNVVGVDLQADLRKAAPGSLELSSASDPDDIAASNVVADWLNVTDVGGVVFTGATFQTDPPGSNDNRVWMDKAGLHQDIDGQLTVDIGQQGAMFTGQVTATALEIAGDGSMRGQISCGAGSALRLEGALAAPSVPPSLRVDWPCVVVDVKEGLGSGQGLARGDDGLWTYSVRVSGRVNLWAIPDGGGTPTRRLTGNLADITFVRPGLARVGGDWYLLAGEGDSRGAIYRVADDGTMTNIAAVPAAYFAQAFGDNGSELLLIGQDYTGLLHILTYDTTGALISDLATSVGASAPQNNIGVISGSFDLGAARFVLFFVSADPIVLNPDGTIDTDNTWPDAAVNQSQRPVGTGWDGSNFVELTRDGNLYTYTGLGVDLTGDDLTGWAAQSWYQTTNDYETVIADRLKFAIPKRSRINASIGSIPGSGGLLDPDSWRLYVGRGATDPIGLGGSGIWLQATSTDSDPIALTSLDFATSQPLNAGTFPPGAPASIQGSGGAVAIDANYNNADDLDTRVTALEAGGGGGTVVGGVDIDCGSASATGVDIDCGSAA